VRERNEKSLRLNLTLDPRANETLVELQAKMNIQTTSELIRRAIRAYYVLVKLNEDNAQIRHNDGTMERLNGLL